MWGALTGWDRRFPYRAVGSGGRHLQWLGCCCNPIAVVRAEGYVVAHDVGEALVEYLRAGRPRGGRREVFLRARAPHGAISPAAVRSVVHHACDRAGLPRVGAHRLRHTVASELLGAGVSLAQIAPILRHASLASTATYAKVDRAALRTLARPWPLVDGAA
jgi:integrase/recombinase XerD